MFSPAATLSPGSRRAARMIFVDSDNAMGAPRGNVDDGFALAALLSSDLPIAALASTFGNTSEARAAENNRRVASLCSFDGPLPRGAENRQATSSEASELLNRHDGIRTILSLGPLTNVAQAITRGTGSEWKEIVVVGFNSTSRGTLPPWWPHEFNITADLPAARTVIESGVPLTIMPLDVAARLRLTRKDLASIDGAVGEHLRAHSNRWFWRCHMLKISASFAVTDLAAAMWLINPQLFTAVDTTMEMTTRGAARFAAGSRRVKLVSTFDADAVMREFIAITSRLLVAGG